MINQGVDNGNLLTVSWYIDGRLLYVGGGYMSRALVKFAILKCTDKGRGSYVEPPASNNTILHILPLKNGGIAYGSFDPASGVFDKHDRLVVFKAPYIGDYNGNWNGFLLSYNGFIVQFGYETFENYQPAFMCLTAFLN